METFKFQFKINKKIQLILLLITMRNLVDQWKWCINLKQNNWIMILSYLTVLQCKVLIFL